MKTHALNIGIGTMYISACGVPLTYVIYAVYVYFATVMSPFFCVRGWFFGPIQGLDGRLPCRGKGRRFV